MIRNYDIMTNANSLRDKKVSVNIKLKTETKNTATFDIQLSFYHNQ